MYNTSSGTVYFLRSAQVDPAVFILAVAPFAALVLVMYWGTLRAHRARTALLASYALVAAELVLYMMLPLCQQPFDCGFWAIFPASMLAVIVAFFIFRYHKDLKHKRRVSSAITGNAKGSKEAKRAGAKEAKRAESKEAKKAEVKVRMLEEKRHPQLKGSNPISCMFSRIKQKVWPEKVRESAIERRPGEKPAKQHTPEKEPAAVPVNQGMPSWRPPAPAPAKQPEPAPIRQLAERPAQQPVLKPAQQPVLKPAQQPVRPAAQPAPVRQPAAAPQRQAPAAAERPPAAMSKPPVQKQYSIMQPSPKGEEPDHEKIGSIIEGVLRRRKGAE